MIYTQEVENMCPVAQGVHHGAAPVPTEGKWVQNKKDRRRDIRFIKGYFPQTRIHGIPKMAHAELVMVHPEKFCWYAEKFLTLQTEEA